MTEKQFRKNCFKSGMILDYIDKWHKQKFEVVLIGIDFEKEVLKVEHLIPEHINGVPATYWIPYDMIEFQRPKLKAIT